MLPWVLAASVMMALPGELFINGAAGASLHHETKAQLAGGARWFPFPKNAVGGLGDVGGFAELVVWVGRKNAGLGPVAGFTYGAPKPRLWASFDAGVSALAGETDGTISGAFAGAATLRVGYKDLAFRLACHITSNTVVLQGDYYGAALEWLYH